MQVVNRTPYSCERVILFDRGGAEILLVAVKAHFTFGQDEIRLSDDQPPIVVADEYRDEPAVSSLRLASELLPPKKNTDILVSGHAIAPKHGVNALEIGVRVGDVMQRAVVFGERRGFRELRRPRPFEKIPICWENCFGGVDKSPEDERDHGHHADNPVGRGFFALKSRAAVDEILLPNIEHASERLAAPGDVPRVVGFGPIAPAWRPRAQFAGTYDDEWMQSRAPLLPDDFDERFLQVAPEPLIARGFLVGSEPCALVGLVPEGRVTFKLQSMPPFVRAKFSRKVALGTPRLETIHIDSDSRTLSLLWKCAIAVHRRVEELREVEIRFDP